MKCVFIEEFGYVSTTGTRVYLDNETVTSLPNKEVQFEYLKTSNMDGSPNHHSLRIYTAYKSRGSQNFIDVDPMKLPDFIDFLQKIVNLPAENYLIYFKSGKGVKPSRLSKSVALFLTESIPDFFNADVFDRSAVFNPAYRFKCI